MSSRDPGNQGNDNELSVQKCPFSRQELSRGGPRSAHEFIFFYGHGSSAGELAVLSNFYEHGTPLEEDGRKYKTSEHRFMWGKAMLFNDLDMADEILLAPSPRKAKNLGRKVRGFDEKIWEENSVKIMANALHLKFSQDVDARKTLFDTGTRIIAEATPRDRIWGIGMGTQNPARLDPSTWKVRTSLARLS